MAISIHEKKKEVNTLIFMIFDDPISILDYVQFPIRQKVQLYTIIAL